MFFTSMMAGVLTLAASQAAPGNYKQTLDQINAFRTQPSEARALTDKYLAEAFPNESQREALLKEKFGDKTHGEHLAAFVAFLESQPKAEPLQWDADMVALAAGGGQAKNPLFRPTSFRKTLDDNPGRAFLWFAIRGYDSDYKPFLSAKTRYVGMAAKGSDAYIACSDLKGKAYQLSPAELAGRPYDPREDTTPPWGDTLSLKQPNIIPFTKADGTLDVVWRDLGAAPKVYFSRYSPSGARLFTKEVPGVSPAEHPLLAGFTEDPQGNLYIARAKDEGNIAVPQPDPTRNAKGELDPNWDRPDVMKLTKLSPDGAETWTKNFARKGGNALGFLSPLSPNTRQSDPKRVPGRDTHSSTSRLAFTTHKGTPIVFALYGASTEWDKEIDGRHQNAYWRALDASTGEPAPGLNGGAMAHSFDNRLLVSDEGVIAVERSDSGLLISNYLNTRSYPLIFDFFYPTTTDGNQCFTQLGGLAPASDGYLALFVGNNSEALNGTSVSGAASRTEYLRNRNLAVIRIKKGFAQELDAMGDKEDQKKALEIALNSMVRSPEREGLQLTGRVYLTGYNDDEKYSAGRAKLVRVPDGNYIVVWERWTHVVAKGDLDGAYDSTWAMKIDQDGNVVKEAVQISGEARIMRGDEPVLWGGKLAFLGGDAVEGQLVAHTVDANLVYKAVPLPIR